MGEHGGEEHQPNPAGDDRGLDDRAVAGRRGVCVDHLDPAPLALADRAPRPDDDWFRSVTGPRPVVEVVSAAAEQQPGLVVRRGVKVAGLWAQPRRCRASLDGLDGARIWTGHGVLTHNLVKIAALTGMITGKQRDQHQSEPDSPTPGPVLTGYFRSK